MAVYLGKNAQSDAFDLYGIQPAQHLGCLAVLLLRW